MNKKIIGCILLICIFIISKGLAGLQTFAYFSDKLVYSTTIENGEWKTKCNIVVELVNQTDKNLIEIDLVAGQDSHPKNNYFIDPVSIENDNLTVEESKSYTFDLEHREAFHCNLQWVYFDVNALDEDGNKYVIAQVREKVHNPPGQVKNDGFTTSYLKIEITKKHIVGDKKKPKESKNNEEISTEDEKINTEENETVGAESNSQEEKEIKTDVNEKDTEEASVENINSGEETAENVKSSTGEKDDGQNNKEEVVENETQDNETEENP